MKFGGLLQNPKFKRMVFVAGGFTIIYLLWNIFVIGGDAAIDAGNAITSAVAALFASLLFLYASLVHKDTVSQPIWLGMGLGMGLWGLADTYWAYYAIALQEEVPVPSIADFLWVIGYFPLGFALIARYRSLRSSPNRKQLWYVRAITLSLLLLNAIFVLRPILADFDPQRAVEGIFNLFYPLGDLFLFHFACLVLVLLQEGRFALSWRLIAAGILITTLSDMLYSYATWQGFYYPDGQANALSILVDASYTIAYIFSACGVYLYGLVWEIREKFALQMEFAPSKRLYVFLATDAEHHIIETSENFHLLVDGRSSAPFQKISLAKAFGLSSSTIQQLIEKIIRAGRLYYEPLMITTQNDHPREIWLIAEANHDPQQAYAGSVFALIADIAAPEALRLPQNPDIRHLMNHLLGLAGSRPKDVSQEMRSYFLEIFRLLSSILYQFGGPHYQNALLAAVQKTIRQKNLPIHMDEDYITAPEYLQGEALASLLIPLLQTARETVASYIGDPIVAEEIGDLERQMNPTVLHDLDTYRLRAYS